MHYFPEQHEHIFRPQGNSFICKQMLVFTLDAKMKQYALEARWMRCMCVSCKGAKDTKETEGGGKGKEKSRTG